MLIVVLAFFNCLVVPLEISFRPAFVDNIAYRLIMIIIDAMFLFDIILMFFTSFLDKKGKEVVNSNQIIP